MPGPGDQGDAPGVPSLRELFAAQDRVASRGQLLELGLAPVDVRRLLRRRELVRLHPGVYLDHTGPPTWWQRAWGAVLAVAPGALSHESALRAYGLVQHEGAVHVAVARHRSVTAPAGVVLHHRSGLAARAMWHLSPPRVRLEDAVLDVASGAARVDRAVSVLADAVQSGRTTPARLRAALDGRPRLRQRRLLGQLVREVGAGSRSPLELRYRRDVERPHGLPRAAGQVAERVDGRLEVRDLIYERFGVVVELDGRLGHADARGRDADLARDLLVAAGLRLTLRLGWRQVAVESCSTAWAVGEVLRARGWRGSPRPCPRCPGSPPIVVAE